MKGLALGSACRVENSLKVFQNIPPEQALTLQLFIPKDRALNEGSENQVERGPKL